ncbi:MAG: CAP domain-containing protein [Candidatus Gracilibacteria bacterium]
MKKFIAKIIALTLLATIIPIQHVLAATTQISTTYFKNVELSEIIPNTFYKNEVYLVKGKTTSAEYETISIVVQKTGTKETTTFTAPVIAKTFSVPVFFPQEGSFYLGIIPGGEGDSKAASIKVSTSLPIAEKTTTAPKINSLNMNYKDDQTVVEINTTFPSLKKITFIQNSQKVTYLSRQNTSSIPINYSDFKNFLPGQISFYAEVARLSTSTDPLKITSAYTNSGINSFSGVEHTFSETLTKDLTANPPDKIDKIGTISFSGKVNVDTELQAYVIKPNGFVDTFDLKTSSKKGLFGSKSIIKKDGNYTFSYVPKTRGRYILEISNKEGLPILNHPTYVGTGIPIIPDFFDLNIRKITNDNTFALDVLRKELLTEINNSRIAHGLTKVEMAKDLNTLAQGHSTDMSKNNYFSHNNLKSQSPEDRRIAAGIKTPVSENIAKDISVKFAHQGLMRSASHRSNILEKDWTKVGIGISKKNGYFYICEEFSTSPLTANDLENDKVDLFTKINTLRKTNNVSELTYSPSLELAAKQLNNESIAASLVLSNTSLSNTLDKFGIEGTTLAIGRTYNTWDPIAKSILDTESRILNSGWETIGIDIQLDSSGNIVMLMIINES